MHRFVLATRNEHKLREFARLLGAAIEIDRLPDAVVLPPESGKTFAANALIKARAAAEATGRAAIADDSGIEAEALGGRPGVYSARFAGAGASDQQNLDRLRVEAPAGSVLRYVCVIALVDPAEPEPRFFEGTCSGRMTATPRGEGGFGYDPVFRPDGRPTGETMAELSDAEKDEISHRGHAARALTAWLAGR